MKIEDFERLSNVIDFRAALEKPKALRAVENGDVVAIELYERDRRVGPLGSYVIDALKEADAEGNTIEIRINSIGGDVFEGIAIASAIARMKAKTVPVVDAATLAPQVRRSEGEKDIRIGDGGMEFSCEVQRPSTHALYLKKNTSAVATERCLSL